MLYSKRIPLLILSVISQGRERILSSKLRSDTNNRITLYFFSYLPGHYLCRQHALAEQPLHLGVLSTHPWGMNTACKKKIKRYNDCIVLLKFSLQEVFTPWLARHALRVYSLLYL